jgi:hypothetical protein
MTWFDCVCSRKTLIYLILTLNHCYPDYDFSLLRAHHFRKEIGVGAVEEAVDSHLLEVSRVCVRPTPQPAPAKENLPNGFLPQWPACCIWCPCRRIEQVHHHLEVLE